MTSPASEYIWYLKFQLSVKERQLESFRNGHKYASMRREYEKICKRHKKRIHELERELAESHAETVTVRKNWSEIFDDLEKEHKKEMEACGRKLVEMEKRALRAERRADELEARLKAERKEKYSLGEKLEGAEGKIKKLTAQVNRDFHNSSKPSSMQGPERKKIPNCREKTERKPGGQPGHELIPLM